MTFSTASHSSPAQAQLPQKLSSENTVIESRETGEVMPKRDEPPKEKPLAHFVAGGYVGIIANESPSVHVNENCVLESAE
jgi:solute carrier family 25 protein 33/36